MGLLVGIGDGSFGGFGWYRDESFWFWVVSGWVFWVLGGTGDKQSTIPNALFE